MRWPFMLRSTHERQLKAAIEASEWYLAREADKAEQHGRRDEAFGLRWSAQDIASFQSVCAQV